MWARITYAFWNVIESYSEDLGHIYRYYDGYFIRERAGQMVKFLRTTTELGNCLENDKNTGKY